MSRLPSFELAQTTAQSCNPSFVMSQPNAPVPPPTSSDLALRVVQLLSALAFGLSAYLLWGSLTGQRLLGCGLESGCGAVTSSRWAYIFRVPVSLPALMLYAAVLSATVLIKRVSRPARQRAIQGFLVGAAAALLGAAIWFIALQVFVIGSICPFCMAAHACGVCVGLILLVRARAKTRSEGGGAGVRNSSAGFALAGLAAVRVTVA